NRALTGNCPCGLKQISEDQHRAIKRQRAARYSQVGAKLCFGAKRQTTATKYQRFVAEQDVCGLCTGAYRDDGIRTSAIDQYIVGTVGDSRHTCRVQP